MTERIHSFQVILSEDIREDDCDVIINALSMIKGVAAVRPMPSDPGELMAEIRANNKWRCLLLDLLKNNRA